MKSIPTSLFFEWSIFMKLTFKAYAKLNLMLDILSALPNGFHELFMVMQSVSLADDVTVELTGGSAVTLTCSDPELPTDERNLARKAAAAFYAFYNLPEQGLSIHIEKHIPKAAGLAGGSADAAAVLQALFLLHGKTASVRELTAIGAKIGSDVPFCALGGLMLAQYTGTVLSFLPAQAFGTFVIVTPEHPVSTAAAYAAFDTAGRVRHPDRGGMLNSIMCADLPGVCRRVSNVFEQFIDVPERVQIKAVMRAHGALTACMSGSGPSVFGVFETEAQAQSAARELEKSYANVFVCRAVGCGVEKADA